MSDLVNASHFIRLKAVHSIHGRVRFRYRCSQQTSESALIAATQTLHGVHSVRVNTVAHTLVINFDPAQTSVPILRAHLSAMSIPDLHATRVVPPPLPIVPATNLLAGIFAKYALPQSLQAPMSLALSLPVMLHGGKDLLTRGITSHVLEALAVSISIYRKDYTAANLTSFLLELGEYLEQSIARRSDDLLKSLLKPVEDSVWVKRGDKEVRVPVNLLKQGDLVIAAVGNVIPVDGVVTSGDALVNEATMTGESAPVPKRRGSQVLSGTVVTEGNMVIYAEQVGADVSAQRIADYVNQSLLQKSNTQLGANQLADRLISLVLSTAVLSRIFSGNWQSAAAILQVDYSCALKLTTPVAFKAAMYHGGKRNILVKSAIGLEKLAEADTVVFDKTGTLTSGILQVTDAITFSHRFSNDDIVNIAASVEEHYLHPIAMAVVQAARALPKHQHFDHQRVDFIVAHGVVSEIHGKRIVVGSRHFLEDDEKIDFKPYQADLKRLLDAGKTLLYIGYDHELIGVIGLYDELRSNTARTIVRLRELGIKRAVMLTGDQHNRAAAIARELQLDEFHAELMPEDKARIMAKLSESGAKIMFVGDGINDAPALSSADVGIAMSHGADIARLAADIVLLDDDIALVARAKQLANITMELIHHNFIAAVGLNSGILAAASFGWLRPVLASALHNSATIALLAHAMLGLDATSLDKDGQLLQKLASNQDASTGPIAEVKPKSGAIKAKAEKFADISKKSV